MDKLKIWLREKYSPESALSYCESTSRNHQDTDRITDIDLPVWLAAQKAVSRYEGLLSPVGPRGRLIRRMLVWFGIIPSLPEASTDFDDKVNPETKLRLVLVIFNFFAQHLPFAQLGLGCENITTASN